MKRLLGLVLVLSVVGCGAGGSLEGKGAGLGRNRQGEVTIVSFQDVQITDADLVHLKGLTNLGKLDLSLTNVTDAGVKDLKKALPDCRISR